jgi:hypothetical protein
VPADVVVVAIDSFFAQAPKLKAPAKTAMIMTALKIRILFITPFVAGCCRAVLSVVRMTRNEFFHCAARRLFADDYRRAHLHQVE